MDIRSYFSRSSKKPEVSKNGSVSNSKPQKRIFIDSDSEDEKQTSNSRTKKSTAKTTEKISQKQKPVVISDSESDNETKKSIKNRSSKLDTKEDNSKKRDRKFLQIDSSSEDNSPAAKRKPVQRKLNDITVKSKFFKETSASAVFGNEPIKRDSSKQREIQEKLKKLPKPVKNEFEIEDDDNFEAALAQLDEVGNNWMDKSGTSETLEIDTSSIIEKSTRKRKADSPKKVDPETPPKKRQSARNRTVESKKPSEYDNKTPKEQNVIESSKNISPKKSKPKSNKHSFRDKLKEFAAFSSQDKQSSDEVSDEKLLSTFSPSTSLSSGYASLSPSESSSQIEKKLSLSSPSISSSGYGSQSPSDSCSQFIHTKNKSAKESFVKPKTEEPEMKKVPPHNIPVVDCSPWVEKYKPDSTKKILGQQGDKSNVKKLINWLNNWYKNNAGDKKPKYVPSGWNADQTGASFKAALLSGPPGVGKTTSVTLVCKELGFDMVEFNASDTRSKRLLQEEVSKLLTNTAITSLFGGDGAKTSVTKKHVLVMDEVDGMAGNEDRGGIQELIHLIKITKVPIICMCNDRNHPKIRSLVNYCFDLRFQRPRVEQIKGFMRSVCFKEKLNVSADDLNNIITSSNNDVRLVLNHLSMLAADKSTGLEASKKYVKLNPWDVLRKVFSKEDHKSMTIHDKLDLFFYDYSIAPLFVQENYLNVKPLNIPTENKCKKMRLFARAADSISLGDRIDKEIRSNSAWTLLPTQAVFSSYIPGEVLEGYCSSMINFPAWLGKNSRTGKIDRLLQEIQVHTRLKISANKQSVNLEYAPFLRDRIVEPLLKEGSEGAKSALDMLHQYDLLKEDLESLSEICNYSNSVDPMTKVDSKVKAAFTRLYNKNPPMRPYSLTAPIKKTVSNDVIGEESDGEVNDDEEDGPDAMIITKKKQPNQSDKVTPSTSRAKPKATKDSSKKGKKK